MEENSKPYSYHTFIYPFYWVSKGKDYEIMNKSMEKNPYWINTDLKDPNNVSSSRGAVTKEERLSLYKEYQYFHTFARNAIYGQNSNVVHNYSFMPNDLKENGHYIIRKDNEDYDLELNAIRLKVFNTGVALFIMECENSSHRDLKSVKLINDLGRRIYLPYISNFSICADSLSVKVGELSFGEDFSEEIDEVINGTVDELHVSMTHTGEFIKNILSYGGSLHFTSKAEKISKSNIQIVPIMGDRMYVASFILDKTEAGRLLSKDNDVKYYFEKDDNANKSVYELAYVDKDDDCTCQDKEMREEMVRDAVYRRWLDNGSLYLMTNYSMILLTSYDADFYVENFLTEYIQMYEIVIAQRSSICKFKREAADISLGMEKHGHIKQRIISRIVDLEERFAAFCGQLCFEEISPEQQGIEMYHRISEALLIEQEKASIKEQIESLYDVSNTSTGSEINAVMLAFTWISGGLSLAALFISMIQSGGFAQFLWGNETAPWTVVLCTGIAGVVIGILSVIIIIIRFSRKK